MALIIPDYLRNKTQGFPESSYGANRVTLILKDGRLVSQVFLAWGSEIVKIGNKMITNEADLEFSITDIRDVTSEV